MGGINQTIAVVDKSGKVVSTVSPRMFLQSLICSNHTFLDRANTSSESSRKPRQPITNGKQKLRRTNSCELRRRKPSKGWNHIQLMTLARWGRQGDPSLQVATIPSVTVTRLNTMMDNLSTNWIHSLNIRDINPREHQNGKWFAGTLPTTWHSKTLLPDLLLAGLCPCLKLIWTWRMVNTTPRL